MGMYTEFHFNAVLPEKTPQEILTLLNYMLGEAGIEKPNNLPNHPLFETARWLTMLCCDSYYFAADTQSTLRHDKFGDYYLCLRCNLKNYGNEIEYFIDWIKPYLKMEEGSFLGFYRYEETETPTLIYA